MIDSFEGNKNDYNLKIIWWPSKKGILSQGWLWQLHNKKWISVPRPTQSSSKQLKRSPRGGLGNWCMTASISSHWHFKTESSPRAFGRCARYQIALEGENRVQTSTSNQLVQEISPRLCPDYSSAHLRSVDVNADLMMGQLLFLRLGLARSFGN